MIVLTHLGVTLLLSGHPEPAPAVLERGPSMSPSYAEGFVWYGDALIHNGRPEEELKFIEHAIELTPNARMLWVYAFIRAEALIHLGRHEDADKALRDIEQKTSLATHLGYVAGVRAVIGDADEARRLMEKARALAPDYSARRFRERYIAISIDKGGRNVERLFDAFEVAVPLTTGSLPENTDSPFCMSVAVSPRSRSDARRADRAH